MSFVIYRPKTFRASTGLMIDRANSIINEYRAAGYSLTLRQLYYQFVARDWIENKKQSYMRLGSVISDARMAGEISWYAIEDRTRNLMGFNTVDSPSESLDKAARIHRLDLWKDQDYHVEIWVEKEALAGVIARPARNWAVDYFACKGYVSASEMYNASQRLIEHYHNGKTPIIIHLGDHDPSGIDMTRDIEARLNELAIPPEYREGDSGEWIDPEFRNMNVSGGFWPIEVRRIALNMDQIRQYNPPPNFAKSTDARYTDYAIEFGTSSWELDALEPSVLDDLINQEIESIVDLPKWKARKNLMETQKEQLSKIGDHYEAVIELVNDLENN